MTWFYLNWLESLTWCLFCCHCRTETHRGAYHLSSYYIAKTGSTWPMEIFFTLCFSAIVYFMVGYQIDAGKFFIYWVVFVVFQLISEELGQVGALRILLPHTHRTRNLRALSKLITALRQLIHVLTKHETWRSQLINRNALCIRHSCSLQSALCRCIGVFDCCREAA